MARLRGDRDGGAPDEIRWRDAHGRMVRCTPPPEIVGEELSREELVGWAERWGVPVAAALQWYDQPDRPPAWLLLRDRNVADSKPRFLGIL